MINKDQELAHLIYRQSTPGLSDAFSQLSQPGLFLAHKLMTITEKSGRERSPNFASVSNPVKGGVLLQETTLFMTAQKYCLPSFIGMIIFETRHGKLTQSLIES